MSGSSEWPPRAIPVVIFIAESWVWRDRARRIVVKDGRIVEVTEVVGVEGSRVIFERYRPPRGTVLMIKRCIAWRALCGNF